MDSLIFDVDGTLWDSRIAVAHAWQDSIRRYTGHNRKLTVDYISPLFGRPMNEITDVLLPELSSEERTALGERCFAEENDWLLREPGLLYPGVSETLEALCTEYPLFIVSNCQQGYIETMLKLTGIGPCFTDWLCYGTSGASKAENLCTLIRQYNLFEPAYVGDTQGDADACAEVGILMIYAAYGFGKVEHPWRTIHFFSELQTL